MPITNSHLIRVMLIALALTLALAVAKFSISAKDKVEAYYSPAPVSTVLQGQQPTSNYQRPPLSTAKVAMANIRTAEPSFPIVPTQPSPVNLHSYKITYVAADDELHTDCIRENMAKEIPMERILPSSVTASGGFKTLCDAETAMPYKPWPF